MSAPKLPIRRVVEHVIKGLRDGSVGKLAAAQLLESSMPDEVKDLPTANGIKTYFHCRRCLEERPEDVSPADFARLSVGFTVEGMQVWCWRHGLNVAHVHFEGWQHPARMDAGKPDAKNRSETRHEEEK